MVKEDDELIGAHLYIERDNLSPVDVNVYVQDTEEKLPLVINIHGGAFIAGDADTLDTQSDRISKNWNVQVATVNYSLLDIGFTTEAMHPVIEEIKDTVRYFIQNADEYNVDTDNIFIMGYSAGGYYAMAASLELTEENVPIRGQILCYAFLNDMLDKFDALNPETRSILPPALFILAGDEPIGGSSLKYEEVLRDAGIVTEVKKYSDAMHGFIEENNPEYTQLHEKNRASKSPEQEELARNAEDYISTWIENCSQQ